MSKKQRAISEIAKEIKQKWCRPNPKASPYVSMMLELKSTADTYYHFKAKDVMRSFLVNSKEWNTKVGSKLKTELREVLYND